jgi:hypothetical protein
MKFTYSTAMTFCEIKNQQQQQRLFSFHYFFMLLLIFNLRNNSTYFNHRLKITRESESAEICNNRALIKKGMNFFYCSSSVHMHDY